MKLAIALGAVMALPTLAMLFAYAYEARGSRFATWMLDRLDGHFPEVPL